MNTSECFFNMIFIRKRSSKKKRSTPLPKNIFSSEFPKTLLKHEEISVLFMKNHVLIFESSSSSRTCLFAVSLYPILPSSLPGSQNDLLMNQIRSHNSVPLNPQKGTNPGFLPWPHYRLNVWVSLSTPPHTQRA